MYYGDKSVKEMDDYYSINTDQIKYPWWKHKDCEKIQQAFNNHAIMLTLAECKELYTTWSDEAFCSGWENGIQDYDLEYIFKLLLPSLNEMLKDRTKRISNIIEQLEQNGYFE